MNLIFLSFITSALSFAVFPRHTQCSTIHNNETCNMFCYCGWNETNCIDFQNNSSKCEDSRLVQKIVFCLFIGYCVFFILGLCVCKICNLRKNKHEYYSSIHE